MRRPRLSAPLRATERADYALRAVGVMAEGPDAHVTARAIAERYGMSPKMLGSVLQALTGAGVLTSRAGWHGGFRLSRPPETISLRDVIATASAPPTATGAGRRDRSTAPAASGGDPEDSVDRFWIDLDRHVQRLLASLTVADLVAGPGVDLLVPKARDPETCARQLPEPSGAITA